MFPRLLAPSYMVGRRSMVSCWGVTWRSSLRPIWSVGGVWFLVRGVTWRSSLRPIWSVCEVYFLVRGVTWRSSLRIRPRTRSARAHEKAVCPSDEDVLVK